MSKKGVILNSESAWIEETVKYANTPYELRFFRIGYLYKDRKYYSSLWDSKWIPDIRKALASNEKNVFIDLLKVIKMEIENQIADYESIYLPNENED